MRIDFHSHVKISKKSLFNHEYFQEMMKEAQAAGLDAIAMTEHFNTFRFMDIYNYLDAHYPYEHGFYNINGFKLFPGIEIDIKEVGHILFIGAKDDIIAIRHALEGHTDRENFLAFDDLLDLAAPYELLKIGAHPFRKSTPLHHLSVEQLQRLDAFDLNGKDLFSEGIDCYQEGLEEFAKLIGLPIVGGSDTHQFLQYGSVMNELSQDCNTIEEIKKCIRAGQYGIHISADLMLKVKSAVLVKQYMKQLLKTEGQPA